ncbi:hypothetical protein PM082_014956 [Marasmius tenuissimus]|nr:hypothetical protein PM082_014956 [Marasmius tenuissimus]
MSILTPTRSQPILRSTGLAFTSSHTDPLSPVLPLAKAEPPFPRDAAVRAFSSPGFRLSHEGMQLKSGYLGLSGLSLPVLPNRGGAWLETELLLFKIGVNMSENIIRRPIENSRGVGVRENPY